MRIHLIIGPTGIGKTTRAVQLALQTGAPVVALDRVQIYPELATGSGRPHKHELQGTVRHYLVERRIGDGELNVRDALPRLQKMTTTLAAKHHHLIIEGGSISLSQAIWKSGYLREHQVEIVYLTVDDRAAYRQLIYQRVQKMLQAQPAITDELATAWSAENYTGRRLVQKVVGYDAILAWCMETGIAPQDLPVVCRNREIRAALATAITRAHLAYAARQRMMFTNLLSAYKSSLSTEVIC